MSCIIFVKLNTIQTKNFVNICEFFSVSNHFHGFYRIFKGILVIFVDLLRLLFFLPVPFQDGTQIFLIDLVPTLFQECQHLFFLGCTVFLLFQPGQLQFHHAAHHKTIHACEFIHVKTTLEIKYRHLQTIGSLHTGGLSTALRPYPQRILLPGNILLLLYQSP